eukprot:26730_1
MPRIVSLKTKELRKRGYNNVHEWLSDSKHLYIGRQRPKFTNINTNEPPNTYVAINDSGKKILVRPYKQNNKWDPTLLSYPVGTYVSKYGQIVEIEIPESKWHNPFKVKDIHQRDQSVDRFKRYLLSNQQLMSSLHELEHYTELGCWCKPAKCHGDTILAEYHKWKFRQKNQTSTQPISSNNAHKHNSNATTNRRVAQRGRGQTKQCTPHSTQSSSNRNSAMVDVWGVKMDTASHVQAQKKIRLICISDTHNSHKLLTKTLNQLYESENDILIHAGDMTDRGSAIELNSVNEWLKTLKFKYKFVVSGNMDGLGLDPTRNMKHYCDGHQLFASSNTVYLQHELYTIPELNNLSIFGTPYTPKFVGGFQLRNENESIKRFSNVPKCDVLISHGPPLGILDKTSRGYNVGDRHLLKKLVDDVKPKVMVFGHVHESYGVRKKHDITFINAAQYNGLHTNRKDVTPIVHVFSK